MSKHKQISRNVGSPNDTFGDIQGSNSLSRPALKNKAVLFVLDDRDLKVKTTILKYAIIPESGISEKSKAIGYSDFFASAGTFEADVLVCHSSALFTDDRNSIKNAVKTFRKKNPDSFIVVTAFVEEVLLDLRSLEKSGTANMVTDSISNDFDLLHKIAERLE